MSNMEKLVVQSDMANIPAVGDFVGVICSEMHIDNYCATIAVAVSNAAEYAVSSAGGIGSELTITFDYCRGGVLFTIASPQACFDEAMMMNESMLMAKMLSDQVEVLDNGHALQLMFAVQGISPSESAQRQSVLQKFYAPALVDA